MATRTVRGAEPVAKVSRLRRVAGLRRRGRATAIGDNQYVSKVDAAPASSREAAHG